MIKKIKIANKTIDRGQPCFVIAEAGVNHQGSFILAKKLVDKAKEAGADAVKFQIFKTEKLVTQKGSQYKMLKKLELPYSAFKKLKKHCDQKGIIFLLTPHSCREDVDLAAELCPAIKVGSGDLTNLPQLKYIAAKKLPIILSTGMATLKEVREAIKTILPINNKLILLHCTTNYPTPFNEVNLKAMQTLVKEFNLPVGYSDHTKGINVSLAAVVLGASVIERHFTLDKNLPGPDHKASLESREFKEMVEEIRQAEKVMGNGTKKPAKSEEKIKKLVRKSIVTEVDIPEGTVLTEGMLIIKRPGTGIEPKCINKVIGKVAKENIKKNQILNFNQLE